MAEAKVCGYHRGVYVVAYSKPRKTGRETVETIFSDWQVNVRSRSTVAALNVVGVC